jgi:histidine ammonia-lyase
VTDSPFVLKAGRLTLAELHRFWRGPARIALEPAAYAALERSAATVAAVVAAGRRVYGINTGFGSLARQTISADQVAELQTRLVLSHSAGVGAPLDDRVVRLVLLLKINALSRGHSGIRGEVVDRLVQLLNEELYPVIPAKGSVGASGDLAPLAHLSAVLLGHGEISRGTAAARGRGAGRGGIAPLELAAKEGLALLNGTQVSTALALHGAVRRARLLRRRRHRRRHVAWTPRSAAIRPSMPRIHASARPSRPDRCRRWLRELLADSSIRRSHVDCDRVQDPYSLRCQPQVGRRARRLPQRRRHPANARPTRSPTIRWCSDGPQGGEVLSGGNFHAEPVAFAADMTPSPWPRSAPSPSAASPC